MRRTVLLAVSALFYFSETTVVSGQCSNPPAVDINPSSISICVDSFASFMYTVSNGPAFVSHNGTGFLSPSILDGTGTFEYYPTAGDIGSLVTIMANIPDPDGAGSCLAAMDVVTVMVLNPANAGQDGVTTVCDNSTATIDLYSLISNEQSGGSWARLNGTGGTFNAVAGTFVPAPGATNSVFRYTVSGTNYCFSDESLATVNIFAQANAGQDGSVSICDNNTTPINLFNLITGEQTGGVWVRISGAGGTFNAATGIFTPAAGATNSTFKYTVTGISPCPNDESIATVNISPQSNAGQDGSTAICDNSTTTINLYNLITGEKNGGAWSRISGTGGNFNAASGTFTPAPGATTSVFRYLITGAAPCPNDTSFATVNISAQTNAGQDGATTICDNSTTDINLFGLIVGEQPGGVWTRTSGSGGIFSAGTGIFTPAPGATTSTFKYTITGIAPCPNDESVATVNIVAQVNAGQDGAVTICEGNTTTINLFSLINNEQAGGTWTRLTGTGGTFNAGAGTFTPATGATTSTFRYALTGTAPCPNDESIATVNIVTQVNAGQDGVLSVCDNSTAVINLYSIITGEQTGGTWARISGSGGTFNAGAGTFIPAPGATTSVFKYTITGGGGCASDDSQATVNITPQASAGTDGGTSVCDNDNSHINLRDLITGEPNGGDWIRISGTGGMFNQTAGIFTAAPGTTTSTFGYVIAGAGPCPNDTSIATVVVNPAPVILISISETSGTINNDGIICIGTTVTLIASGGVTYAWNTGGNTAIINVTPSSTTTYTVTVTNASGCSSTATATITANPLPTPSISVAETSGTTNNDGVICIGASATLTANGGAIYMWNTGSNSPTINVTPSSTTTYTVTVTNANNCSATATKTITVNPLPTPSISISEVSGTINNDGITCPGAPATLTATGGVIYAWNTGGNTATINVTPLSTTTYTVTVTNANNCSATATNTITVNPLPSPSISVAETSGTGSNDGIICAGATATLTATGGVSYTWNTGSIAATIDVTPSSTTTYTVTVTNANNCSVTATVTIAVNPLPALGISIAESSGTVNNDGIICPGVATTLTATSGSSYLWSTGSTAATINVMPSSTTTYTVTVTNVGSCSTTASATITVNQPSPATITISENSGTTNLTNGVICSGETANLTANIAAGYQWKWSTGATTQTIQVSVQNAYTVTVTDANICTSTQSASITVNPLPTPSITFTEHSGNTQNDGFICGSDTIILTGSGGNYTYNWLISNGITGNSAAILLKDLVPADYTATVIATDGNQCKKEFSKNITVFEPPIAFIDSVTANAFVVGADLLFYQHTLPGNNPIVQWVWNFGADVDPASGPAVTPPILPPHPAFLQRSYTQPGIKTIMLEAKDSKGCISKNTVQKQILEAPKCAVNAVTCLDCGGNPNQYEVCQGASLKLVVTNIDIKPGNTVSKWHWAPGNATPLSGIDQDNVTLKFNDAGPQTVYVYFEDNGLGNVCVSDSFPVHILVTPAPVATLSAVNSQLCEGGELKLRFNFFPANSNYEVTGINGVGVVQDGFETTVTPFPPVGVVSQFILQSAKNLATGCSTVTGDTLEVFVNPSPQFGYNVIPVCPGQDLTIQIQPANPNFQYSWSKDGAAIAGTQSGLIISQFDSFDYGNYAATVTDEHGCSAVKTQTIDAFNLQSPPSPAIAGDETPCDNSFGTLYSAGQNTGSQFFWTVTGGVIQGQFENNVWINWNSGEGVKSLSVLETTASGCSGSSDKTVTVSGRAPEIALVGYAPEAHLLVCADGAPNCCYQWGTSNLDGKSEQKAENENNQAWNLGALGADPDSHDKLYWVEIWYSDVCGPWETAKCRTRCYYWLSLTGVQNLEQEGFVLDVYPNPAVSEITLSTTAIRAMDAELRLLNLSGNTIRRERVSVPAGAATRKIDLSGLASGVYIAQMRDVQSGAARHRIFVVQTN